MHHIQGGAVPELQLGRQVELVLDKTSFDKSSGIVVLLCRGCNGHSAVTYKTHLGNTAGERDVTGGDAMVLVVDRVKTVYASCLRRALHRAHATKVRLSQTF